MLPLPLLPHSLAWTLPLEESIGSKRSSPSVAVVRHCPLLQPHPEPSSHPATFITGTVFYGVHNVAGKEVAIKVEPAIAKHSPLRHESKIYKSLMGGPGVPWILYSGKQGEYNVMVIDLLGPSLEDLFKMCNRHFSLKTVLLLADQLVSICIYRDLRGRPPPRTFHIRHYHFLFGRFGYLVGHRSFHGLLFPSLFQPLD